MPNISEGAIRSALRRVEKSRRQETLTDGDGRGTGRLVLTLRPMPKRVMAEWMAQQWRDRKRTKSKIGSYPAMPLIEAREVFKRDFAQVIQKGSSIKAASDTRPGTVADLFEGYVNYLRGAGKSSWHEVEKGLDKIADLLGRNRLARDISTDDVLGVIRPIYKRNKLAMADHVRGYIHSAYSWGIKSERDYRSTSPRRFKLFSNPAAGIPTEPKVPGTRWLDEDEFVQLYRWLEFPDAPVHPPYTRAVRILMLNWAVKAGLCPRLAIKKPKFSSSKRFRWLFPGEFDRLVASASNHLVPILQIAVETGAHNAELIYLQWDDIDLEWGEIHLRNRVVKISAGIVVRLKALRYEQKRANKVGPNVFRRPPDLEPYGEKRDSAGQTKICPRSSSSCDFVSKGGHRTAF